MPEFEKIEVRMKNALTIALNIVYEVDQIGTKASVITKELWLQSAAMLAPKIYDELKHLDEARIRNAAAGSR